ncbi:MAG: cytochrome c biogenesis protein CcsA [Fibrobacteria bacterium]|nr:cytochrome c biogenesis protein CcsA [Fibrobacteria bacterium]
MYSSQRFMKYLKSILVLISLIISIACNEVEASPITNYDNFSKIIILENGRKKPLDTYARNLLLEFSGRASFNKKPAIQWLAKMFFLPEETQDDKIFMVNEMQVIQAMDLNLETSRKFSYNQLKDGLGKLRELSEKIYKINEKERSLVQKELLRLSHSINNYMNLASCFQFALPYPDFAIQDDSLARALGVQSAVQTQNRSFYSVFLKSEVLNSFLQDINTPSDTNLTPAQKDAMRLSRTLHQWSNYYKRSPIMILPSTTHNQKTWISPWEALGHFSHSRGFQPEMDKLQELTSAYLDGNQVDFDLGCVAFNKLVAEDIWDGHDSGNISLEVMYNKYSPFLWSKLFYGLMLITALCSLIFLKKTFYRISLVLLILALIPHSLGMFARMLIMGRPPVTNLYETFIFVGWMSAILGIVAEWFSRRGLGFIIAGFSSLAMLLIAQKYAMDGDTMGMLVAVLDSNFWLASHVITITMGYAGCCAAGVAGHVYVLQKVFNADKEKLTDTSKMIYGILAFGLVFSFIGTVLGGIWADQSWGRFWGWDPKENGALLIVLWCAALFHARLDGMIKHLGMAIGSILCTVIVMFAWFGVNLLGVGLHAYGFSSGVFLKLLIYFIAEFVFIVFSLGWIMQKTALEKKVKQVNKG